MHFHIFLFPFIFAQWVFVMLLLVLKTCYPFQVHYFDIAGLMTRAFQEAKHFPSYLALAVNIDGIAVYKNGPSFWNMQVEVSTLRTVRILNGLQFFIQVSA